MAAEVAKMATDSRVRVVQTDVTDLAQVEAMVEQSIAEFGSVDVLVNNVGWTIDRLFLDKPRGRTRKRGRG